MIITFASQKGGVGKTTLAVAFANYLSLVEKKKVHVYDFDFQKSFYQKWIEDEDLDLPRIYDVTVISEEREGNIFEYQNFIDMQESEEIYLFDLAGTLDQKYIDLLIFSDFLIIPFEYSDVSARSTLVFCNLLAMIDSTARRIFIRSKFDKGYNYKNQEMLDAELENYGKILENPVYKKNALQSINTRQLTYDQKYGIINTVKELLAYMEKVNNNENEI
ncbi:hypothetical protein CAPN002_25950 [Capnocytophaga stomatis]|uniref:ParA family protein n=1 Tax=Capnocytophaga stomatis TaxID=1848904 RepID=UPI0019527CC4|nr:ParA family protein [Capnocytophaga stomatis]GIJ95377.1 hypothetical protein CAPN002_25950 [Capnocytophaga stomatis]